MDIQWFPGHMAKAKRQVQENLKLVDAVFEILDARIPQSSRNPLMSDILGDKPRLIVLSKSDLADPKITGSWINWFSSNGTIAVEVDLVRGQGINVVFKTLNSLIENKVVLLKYGAIKPRLPRCMVVGIPNVGKSSLINRMVGKRATRTGYLPGVTRGQQWIRIREKIELLDTPGVLWPKFESRETGLKLAATNAVKEDVFDPEEIAQWLLEWITNNYPLALEKHYAMNEFPCDGGSFFELIGEKRGLLTTGGAVDRLRTSLHIIKEFRDGKLGRFSLEKPQ